MNKPDCITTRPSNSFAGRMNAIPRSCIRELLSGNQPKLISFGGGVPHDSCVPIEAIQTAFEATLLRYGASAFRYSASEGESELREFIANQWLCRFGVSARPEEILIVNGSQQALDLLGKVLIDPRSPVLMERPTYVAALQAFSAFEPRFHEVSLLPDGPDVTELSDKLSGLRPRLFYTIPTFQNPSGMCYSEKKRLECAEALRANPHCVLIEDDPYSELYYDYKPPKPICALGVDNAVMLGTFSKIVAPGLRLGWIWARGELMRHLITAKQAADLCTGRFQQLLLMQLLRRLNIEAHLKRNRAFYWVQRARMQSCLKQHLSGIASWDLPPGGMFYWVKLNLGVNARALLAASIKRGVAFADGSSFHIGGAEPDTLRLNFTQLSLDDMENGLGILAETIRSHRF